MIIKAGDGLRRLAVVNPRRGSGAVLPGGGRCAPHIELVDDGTHTSEPTSISQEPLAGFLAWPLIHLMNERHDRCGGSVARKALGE
jgi:hypothetical protein